MAIDPSIAMGYRGLGELPNPMNQLAQVSQIQSSQRQGEMAQMQIQQMRRDETALTQFYADVAKNGGPTNPVEIEDAMIKSGVRDIVNSGLTARMTRSKLENQQKQFAGIMGARMPTGAPMAAPAAAAVPDLAQGNALMPAPRASVPSVNALPGGGANNAAEIAFKQQQRDALIGMGTTQSIAAARAIDADIALLAKEPVYHTVTGVGLVNPRDKSVVVPSVETAPNSIRELEAFMKMTPQQQDTFMKMKRASAGGTTVNVSTEKKYGEAFGGKLAEKDIAAFTTAEKAPQLAESANRIIDIVKNGNIFVGPVADIKLNIARAMNVTGATNQEKIANTEALVAATGQSTLDAIKSAGLGTGQGFTDKDLGFLRGIAGGTINLTEKTLTELATLQHRAATRSAEAWNKRVNEMPSEVVKGTGLSTAPIEVPALSAVAVTPIFAINPQTGARIQSIDGGNTWKPAGVK
jgi:hypothetical protein